MIWLLANWKIALGIAGTAVFAVLLAITTIDRNQWRAAAKKADAALALVKPAQDLALAKAKQAIADKEAKYRDKANAADQNHADAAATARTDADAYSAAHRVPACPSGAPRGTPASPQGGDPGIPADLSTSAIVADADVRACSGAAAYALAAHEWVSTLNH